MNCLSSIFPYFFLVVSSLFVPIALAQSTLSESSKSVTVDCEVFGHLVDGSFKTILNESWEVDEELGGINKIPFVANSLKNLGEGACMPVGVRSELFGNPKGLQLKITAWTCMREEEGIDALYFQQKIYLKDTPQIVGFISPEGQIGLNEDPTDRFTFNMQGEHLPRDSQEQKPIVLPEGQFSYINSYCKLNYDGDE